VLAAAGGLGIVVLLLIRRHLVDAVSQPGLAAA
jgi:hypothetical protein